jgi:hypothetical protein
MTSGTRAFCSPINQPINAKFASVAGALQMRMEKYRSAKPATLGSAPIRLRAEPVEVVGAKSLCCDASRSHSQEIDAHVQESEYGRANRDGTQVRGVLEVTGYAGIDHAD